MPFRLIAASLVTLAAFLAALPVAAQRPGAGAAADSAMAPLAWLIGEWEGEVVSLAPNGRSRGTAHETVEGRLDGRVLVMEGIGREPSADGTGRAVHHALGVLTYDPERRRYVLRALRDGGVVDAEAALTDGVFTWSFEVPAGRVRFQIRQVDGEWHEIGEYSSDGSTWRKMLAMKLRRVGVSR